MNQVQEVDRGKPKRVEVRIECLSRIEAEQLVDIRIDVYYVERGDLENLVEEALSVCRQLDLEERQQDNQLLGVDHAPQLVQRC